jgi:hypothetical protein
VSTTTLSPSQSISGSVSSFAFSLLIPGNQILSAQTLIQNYIQQFVGNQSIVSVNASWQNNVYTVTGQSSLQSISDNFPNSVQYQELLNALRGNTENAIQPMTSPSVGMPIGIGIGSVLVIGLIAAGAYLLIRNRHPIPIKRRKSTKPVQKKKYTKPNHFVSESKDVIMVPNQYVTALETKKQRSKYEPLTINGNTVAHVPPPPGNKYVLLTSKVAPGSIPPPPPLPSQPLPSQPSQPSQPLPRLLPPPPPPSLQFYTKRKMTTETKSEGARNSFNPASRTLLTRKPSMSEVSRQHSRLPLVANPTILERERSQSDAPKYSRLPSMMKIGISARTVNHQTMNKDVVIEMDPTKQNEKTTQYLPLRSNSIANLIKKFEK